MWLWRRARQPVTSLNKCRDVFAVWNLALLPFPCSFELCSIRAVLKRGIYGFIWAVSLHIWCVTQPLDPDFRVMPPQAGRAGMCRGTALWELSSGSEMWDLLFALLRSSWVNSRGEGKVTACHGKHLELCPGLEWQWPPSSEGLMEPGLPLSLPCSSEWTNPLELPGLAGLTGAVGCKNGTQSDQCWPLPSVFVLQTPNPGKEIRDTADKRHINHWRDSWELFKTLSKSFSQEGPRLVPWRFQNRQWDPSTPTGHQQDWHRTEEENEHFYWLGHSWYGEKVLCVAVYCWQGEICVVALCVQNWKILWVNPAGSGFSKLGRVSLGKSHSNTEKLPENSGAKLLLYSLFLFSYIFPPFYFLFSTLLCWSLSLPSVCSCWLCCCQEHRAWQLEMMDGPWEWGIFWRTSCTSS